MMIQQSSLQGFFNSFRSFFSFSFVFPPSLLLLDFKSRHGFNPWQSPFHFFPITLFFFFFPSYSYCSILLFSSPFCPPLICSYPFPFCFFSFFLSFLPFSSLSFFVFLYFSFFFLLFFSSFSAAILFSLSFIYFILLLPSLLSLSSCFFSFSHFNLFFCFSYLYHLFAK